MGAEQKFLRFAKLCTTLNIGTENGAELLLKLGHITYIEHDRILKNVPLNQNMVEEYLIQKNLINTKLFSSDFISKLLGTEGRIGEYFTFNEVKAKIKEHNTVYVEAIVVFQIYVDELAYFLKINREVVAKSLLEIFPDLPTKVIIKPHTRIPIDIVEAVCKNENYPFDKLFQDIAEETVESKYYRLEGLKEVGRIDLAALDSSLNKTMNLSKAETVYNVSQKQIIDLLKRSNFPIKGLPNENLNSKMIAVLNKEFDKGKILPHTTIEVKDNVPTVSIAEPIVKDNTLLKHIVMKSPIQKILFGSPGTGKSWAIENHYLISLKIPTGSENCIKTVFHPEYTYGDFMGKLMPHTNDDGLVEYRFYSGHFLKALAQSYKNIILSYIQYKKSKEDAEKAFKREIDKSNRKDFTEAEKEILQERLDKIQKPIPQNVALIIDEINRGNSAAIFGVGFQLLDRDDNGWSSYSVRITELEYKELLKEISLHHISYKKQGQGSVHKEEYLFDSSSCTEAEYVEYRNVIYEDLKDGKKINLDDRNVKLPPNLSIIASMNTSDNSIYFMDSAFKRRWDWEFIDITSEEQRAKQVGRKLADGYSWQEFVDNLNTFIKDNGSTIRKIEDKQIGYFFIKDTVISLDSIRNKLLFFLWDSIFSNDKKPLERLLGNKIRLITFGDFVRECDSFLNAIKTYKQNTE
jgi:hypothetical protein